MKKSRLWILLVAAVLLGAAPTNAAVRLDVEDGRLVRLDRGARAESLPLPARAVTTFAVAGDRVLIGAEPRTTAPATDGRGGGMNLWSVTLDGSEARRLTTGRTVLRAVWSDAARLIAVWTLDNEIRLMGLDGRVVRTLARGASPAFSPDGARLAYSRVPAAWQPGELPGGFDLHVVDLATGTDRELTAGYDDAEPVWTPDGRSILFLSGRRTGLTSFWIADADGGGIRQVTNLGKTRVDEDFVPNPSANAGTAWSRDGSMLLYGAVYSPGGEVVVLRFDRSFKALEARDLGAGRSPQWSERGTVLATRKGAAGSEVVELSLEGPAVRKVVAVPDAPSPDPSSWQPGRGEELLSSPVEKHHTNPPFFRYPLPAHPPGPRYYYDNNRNAGWIASWKCNGETYDNHTGSDFPAACGTQILAGQHGYVFSRNDGCPNSGFFGNTCGGGYGNYVAIDHGYGWISIYAHMWLGTPVGFGAVGCGQYIGTSASSGSSTGCHLHFEVQRSGFHGDPFAGPCSGTVSLWCNQNGDGAGFPGRICC